MFTLYGNAPQPPVDMVMPANYQIVFIIFTSVTLLVMLIYCIRLSIKEHDPLPALSVMGGVLTAATVEFIYGPLGLLWYPSIGQACFIEFAGRQIPIFVATGMGFWYGPMMIIIGSILMKSRSPKDVWLLFAAIAVFDIIMEVVGIYFGVFCYYGDQGLRIGGFPLWWDLSNASLTVLLMWLIASLRKVYLNGWRSWLIILLLPSLATAVNGFNAIYGWLAVNTGDSAIIYAGTAISIVVAFIAVDFVASRFKKTPVAD